jgi:hypothetical protein
MDKIKIYISVNGEKVAEYFTNAMPRIGESIYFRNNKYRILDIVYQVYGVSKELESIVLECEKITQ